ncbi:zinc finger HIT domain-containing protein 2 [Canis lupus baileyi]|uniref:Zinc finger HIT-type containing 2 n=3 Tax=Canis lupus TaxID=9612 RepID=A0A8C0RG25_CANLF|nr:zinc finger HIT domain-containing protein 2 [Canis lupus familiaris]XP_540870.1 zinc finger HIT domain-containing protein 2 [Canis lupus familiaris]|eukprot:XP_540870.1 zinc finger HIT domain-containing protein 2 [Canis lupus familiaris]
MEPAGPCGFCPAGEAQPARYTCPRCNVPYCSLRCYRAHGTCAEDFYRDQVLGELRGRSASPSRLASALRRLRRQRETEDDPEDAGLRPGPAPGGPSRLWELLAPAEKVAFERLLNRGEAGRLLPPWRPWWWGRGAGPRLLEEVGDAADRDPAELEPTPARTPPEPVKEAAAEPFLEDPPEACAPAVPTRIPVLASLSRGRASPLVRFQLPNVLFAYAHTLVLYHGGDEALLSDFCATLLGVSGALGAQQVFASAEEALQAAAQVLEAGEHPPGPLGTRGAMREAARILMGESPANRKGYTLAALGHLAQTLSQARKQAVATEERDRLYRARKKCQFLLAWSNENEAALTSLALDCARAHRAHAVAAEEVVALTEELEQLWGGPLPPAPRILIEELPG